MNKSTLQSSPRISVVDSLRGFAVVGIIVIHFLEHLNFYSFPEPSTFEQGLWDTIFYLGASKMYAIFALLFGLSCYIQHHNQEKRGYDFRPRFAWRMLLLFVWGEIDLIFFNGDVLCTYAALGLFLIPLVKAKERVLWICAAVLFCQPIEIYYIIAGIINPETQPMNLGLGPLWGELYKPCASGGFLDVAKANLMYGLQLNFGWAIEHGRFTQTLMLFIVGMLLGRKRLFIVSSKCPESSGNSESFESSSHLKIWKRILIGSVIAFALTQPLVSFVPSAVENRTVSQSLNILFTAWRNFAMMAFYVSGITLLYYKTRLRRVIDHLKYIGKMSLTDYLLQSIVGGWLFYNWGLGLHTVASHGYSFLLSIPFLLALYAFCRCWTTHFRRGPLEEVWYRLTWIGRKMAVR